MVSRWLQKATHEEAWLKEHQGAGRSCKEAYEMRKEDQLICAKRENNTTKTSRWEKKAIKRKGWHHLQSLR